MSLKRLLLLVCIISGSMLKAQFNNDFLYYVKYGTSVNLHAEYELNSTAIQNGLIDKFITGGNIDSSTRAKSQKKLNALNNRIGGNYFAGATVFFGKKDSKYRFIAGLKQVELLNATFSNDMYSMVFFGNKAFAGQTADVGNTNVNHFKYQEIKLGLIWDNIDTSAKIGFSVSYLKGQSFFQANTGSSSIYTAPDASQINFNVNGSLAMSDTAKGHSGIGAFNGNGMSAEFFADMPYQSRLGLSKFFVSVNNLGFIRWNQNTVNYTADTSYIFKGVTVNNLFQLNDNSAKNLSKDSLVKNLTQNKRQKLSTNLPVSLFILHTINFNQLFALNTGFRYFFNGNYKPYLFAEGQFKIHKNFTATAHLGYGGYGRLTGGLNIELKVKKTYFRIGSNAIQGYVAPQSTLGQGLFFSLSKKI